MGDRVGLGVEITLWTSSLVIDAATAQGACSHIYIFNYKLDTLAISQNMQHLGMKDMSLERLLYLYSSSAGDETAGIPILIKILGHKKRFYIHFLTGFRD